MSLFQVGIEGAGFEPTIDALFGDTGFFPDASSKVLRWVAERAQMLREALDRMEPDGVKKEVLERMTGFICCMFLLILKKNISTFMNNYIHIKCICTLKKEIETKHKKINISCLKGTGEKPHTYLATPLFLH